jgi:hypothetical protein
MRLKELFDILKNTELKQIIIGEDDQQVLDLLNLALIEVYGKFNILTEEQIIQVVQNQTRYRLQDNSQRVVQVYYRDIAKEPLLGEDAFIEVPLNDINDDESVFTPQPYVLHIPNPDTGRIYSVIQTVIPPLVTKDNIDTLDFIIPPQFIDPIMFYAAYRGYKSMNGDERTEIGSHWRAYVQACKEVYKKGMINYSMMTNFKLYDRGYA